MEELQRSLIGIVIVLLPGATAVWAFESQAGEWGIRRPDRVLRFIAVSGLLQVLGAPLTFLVWRAWGDDRDWTTAGHLPWLLWLIVALYGLAPAVLGYIFGRLVSPKPRVADAMSLRRFRAIRAYARLRLNLGIARFAHSRRGRSARKLVARLTRSRPPRAWDYFFAKRPDGWLRIKLRAGPWIGGVWADGSYASGYPHEPQDLFLRVVAEVDPSTGEFQYDQNDEVVIRDSSVLVRWDEISYLEFIDG